jgi:hypothetical protein
MTRSERALVRESTKWRRVIGAGEIYAMPPYLARLNLEDGTGLMGGRTRFQRAENEL